MIKLKHHLKSLFVILFISFNSISYSQTLIPIQLSGTSMCGTPDNIVNQDATNCTALYRWNRNLYPYLPTSSDDPIVVRLNLIFVQDLSGGSNFQENNQEQNAIIDDMISVLNNLYSNMSPPNDWSLCRNLNYNYDVIPNLKIQFIYEKIYIKSQNWSNDSGTLCPGTYNNWINDLENQVIALPNYQPGINVFFTTSQSVQNELIINQTTTNYNGNPISCSQQPSYNDHYRTSRIHMPDFYLKWWYMKNIVPNDQTVNPQLAPYLPTVRNWDVSSKGHTLAHELGHSFNLHHYCVHYSTNECPESLMNQSYQSSHNYLPATEVGNMYRAIQLSNIRRFVIENCYNSQPLTLTQNTTWDFDVKFFRDIEIEEVVVLTITCNTYMTQNAKIIVKPGGKLIIDGGKISADDISKTWQGIEVWGNRNQSQIPHTNGLSDYQGEIEVINGGTIENAINAISAIKYNDDGTADWSKTGGIVTLNDAVFKNNNYDVWIGGYHNILPATGREIRNYSSIINCEFENNDDMFSAYNGYAFVGLWDVGVVTIKGNSFKNLKTIQTTEEKGRGIIVWSSSVNIRDYCPSGGSGYSNLSQTQALSTTPCTNAEPNYFEGLYYGIESFNSITKGNSIVHIDNAEFNNVYHGIHLLNTDYAIITNCDFDISATDPAASSSSSLYDSYGIYLDGCDAYRIEENHFNKFGAQPGIRGIVVDNSDKNNNEIYKNYMDNIGYAVEAQGENYDGQKGLGIYCNEINSNNSSNYYDVIVLDEGIKEFQTIQLQNSSGQPDFYAAGNIFTPCSGNNYGNYYNASNRTITYFPDANNVPQCVYNVNISQQQSQYLQRSCPTKLGSSLSLVLQNRSSAMLALNSAKTIYNIWKDGGDANLDDEVETTQPWDVYIQFNELIAESPYLSDEVLIATIENDAFTSQMIKLIMIANPQSTRSDEVMEALYNRVPPLPESYIEEILAEEGTISQLEVLEANVAACQHRFDILSNDAERLYKMERNDGADNLNDYISFLSSQSTLESDYKLAELYLEASDFESMNTILNNIPSNHELSSEQTNEYNELLDFYDIIKSMKQEGVYQGVLSENDITELESLMESENAGVAKSALALLILNNPEYSYHEVVKPVIIEEPPLMQPYNNNNEFEEEENQYFNIYPNPSYDFFTIKYETYDKYENLFIEIKNTEGRSVMRTELETGNNEELINTTNLAPGMYQVMIYGDNNLIETIKITKLK